MAMLDITEERYGKLVALSPDGQDKRSRFYWRCICDCGNEVKVLSNNLRSGNTKSCGCEKNALGKDVIDMAGQKFGELTVIKRDMSRVDEGKTYWLCECSCGEVVSVWRAHLIRRHNTKCAIKGNHATSVSAKRTAWSDEIKERFNYTCQKCGVTGSDGDIHAHHILSFTAHPELGYDLDNGSCLCENCHKQFHNIYGIMRNTVEEFTEWLKEASE